MSRVNEDGALVLADGRVVLPAGVILPRGAWREAAVARLREAASGGDVELGEASGPDRHGRLKAAMRTAGAGEPLAVLIIDAGLAWADAEGEPSCFSHLLRIEAAARESRRGMWSDSAFAVLSAASPARILERRGEFVLVEGTVLSVGVRPKRTYLNFGAFWNEDFTTFIDTDAAARIVPAGLAPGDLTGRRVRIRGYVLDERGPAVAVTQPGQLELVDDR